MAGGNAYVPGVGRTSTGVLPGGVQPFNVPADVGGLPAGVSPIIGGMANGMAPGGMSSVVRPRTAVGGGGYSPGPGATPTGRTAVPAGSAEVGGIPGILEMLGQMFGNLPNSPPGTAIAGLPTYDTAFANTARTGNARIGGTLGGEDATFQQMMQQIMQSAGSAGSGISNIRGEDARNARSISNVIAPTISADGTSTQSADQIARDVTGGDSMFVRNIMPAYSNLFKQNNDLAAATAKESAGNLTGSGYANTIGTALNRNVASQDAMLADIVNNLVTQEIGRQGAGASIAAQRNIGQAGMDLQAQTTSAQLAQQAAQLAEQARASGRADMMQAAQVLNQRAMQQAAMEQQAMLANAGWEQEANMFNAGQENSANSQFFNAGVQRNQRQAEMDAARQSQIYGQAGQMSMQNAQQMMQLLMQMFGGGQPVSNQTSGGFGAMLPGLMQMLAMFL